jgi:hypothetical protein
VGALLVGQLTLGYIRTRRRIQPVDQRSIPKRSLDADFGQLAAKWLRELLIQQVRGVP